MRRLNPPAIVFAPGLLLAMALAPSPARGEDTQVFIEYRFVQDGSTANSSQPAQKLWRYGDKRARVEQPMDPRTGAQILTIINQPDIYLIDETTKRGRHIVDHDSGGRARLPVVMSTTTSRLQELEVGRELEFFKANHAAKGTDEDVEGIHCVSYELELDGYSLKLDIDLAARAPKKLRIKGPRMSYSIVYLRYLRFQPPQKELYEPGKDVTFPPADEANGFERDEAASKQIDTPFGSDSTNASSFTLSFLGEHMATDQLLCWDRPILFYRFDLRDADAVAHLSRLAAKYKGTQLCFFPLPDVSSPEGKSEVQAFLKRPRRPFPLYSMSSNSPWLNATASPTAVLVDRNDVSNDMPDETDEERAAIDQAIDKIVNDGSPDSDIVVGDVTAQMKKNEEAMARKDQGQDFRRQMSEGSWDELDQQFADECETRRKGPNGSWLLESSYAALSRTNGDEASYKARIAVLRKWAEARPVSDVPRAALGRVWTRYAWLGRGGGWASDLTPQQSRAFTERMGKAREWFESAEALKERCPVADVGLVGQAGALTSDHAKMYTLYRVGQEVDPTYQYLTFEMARYLAPKWGGERGERERFLERVFRENRGGVGPETYARTVFTIMHEGEFGRRGELIFKRTDLSWELTKKGFGDLLKRYPVSLNFNYYAFLACAAGDRAAARDAFQKIGEDYFLSVWGNRVNFVRARRWADRERKSPTAPPAPARQEAVQKPSADGLPYGVAEALIAESYISAGVDLQDAGMLEASLWAFSKQAAEKDPKAAYLKEPSQERLARVYEALGMSSEALATYRALIAAHPDDPRFGEFRAKMQAGIDEIERNHRGETASADEKAKIERVFADLDRRYGRQEAAPVVDLPSGIAAYLNAKNYLGAGLALERRGQYDAALWAFTRGAAHDDQRDPMGANRAMFARRKLAELTRAHEAQTAEQKAAHLKVFEELDRRYRP